MNQIDLNTFIAISAVVVALVSLIVSIWEGVSNRRHNKLSVRPSLRIDRNTGLNEDVRITLINTGLGPAIIKKYKVFLEQKEMGEGTAGSPISEAMIIMGYQPVCQVNEWIPEIGDTLIQGELNNLLISKDYPNGYDQRQKLLKDFFRISIHIEFESMYKETFYLHT